MASNHSSGIQTKMCGRFSLEQYPKTILEALELEYRVEFEPRIEIYPTNEVTVAIDNETDYELVPMIWGFKRSFSKTPLINTRSAEAWHKKTWADSLNKRRCIIPASGFYEWNQNQPKGKRDKYKINPIKEDGFALGGIYEINTDGEMNVSVLTTAPNNKMQQIHHRMPVILDFNGFETWFKSSQKDEITQLMKPIGDERIDLIKM